MSELMACPFCGPKYINEVYEDSDGYINCQRCGTVKLSLKFWYNRPIEYALRDALERVVTAVPDNTLPNPALGLAVGMKAIARDALDGPSKVVAIDKGEWFPNVDDDGNGEFYVEEYGGRKATHVRVVRELEGE